MMGLGGEGEWSGDHDEEFWRPTGQHWRPLYQHLPLSFLYPQLADAQTSYWIHSLCPSPLACLHYLLSKETCSSGWYVLCKSQLCGNSTWQILADLLNSPPYRLGKHKNVILNCLEIGVRISYPGALKTNWMGLSWLVKCSMWPTSSTSAKPTSPAAHVAWFFPKKKPSDKMVEFRPAMPSNCIDSSS